VRIAVGTHFCLAVDGDDMVNLWGDASSKLVKLAQVLCCSVLQCVLQCVAVCCSMLQW